MLFCIIKLIINSNINKKKDLVSAFDFCSAIMAHASLLKYVIRHTGAFADEDKR